MSTTFATRNRPFTPPYNVTPIAREAAARRKSRECDRAEAIKSLVSSAPVDNKDEFYWTLVYDTERAPSVTGREMILEYGIIPVPPQELVATADLHDELWTIIESLSRCSVYLINTNHLCDRDLYSRLYYRILDEECRALPPSSEAAEFIDCLHPIDMEHPIGKSLYTSNANNLPTSQPAHYTRSPEYNTIGTLCSRDTYLPKPW